MPLDSREPSMAKMGHMVRCGESHQRMKCLGRRNHKQADLVRDMRARLLHGVKVRAQQCPYLYNICCLRVCHLTG